MNLQRSIEAFANAKQLLPGGVNSPVRSFKSVGGTPPFIARAVGSHIYDIDGNEYIDYVGSYGPAILGHAYPGVTKAIQTAAEYGYSYGAPTLSETELAKLVVEAVPSIEMVRMVNSGTEATMSALRLARAYTGRNKIIKFVGCYHGHHDSLLVRAGSGATTFGVPDSPGVPKEVAANTLTLPYNDEGALEKIFKNNADEIAAVIIEPVAGNMGTVLPKPGYLAKLRKLTHQYGSLLIFDEVMSGFRVAYGGAQAQYEIVPDLTCLGKVIGGGLPVGAYGGKKEIMEMVSPAGPMYQAGTLSGNPLAMAAGIETLKTIQNNPDFYPQITEKTKTLCEGLQDRANQAGVACQIHYIGAMFCVFFSSEPIYDYESALKSDTEAFKIYFEELLEQGIYLSPSQFETLFMSAAHSEEDLALTLKAATAAFRKVAQYQKGK